MYSRKELSALLSPRKLPDDQQLIRLLDGLAESSDRAKPIDIEPG
jgi:hypothetical protein